MLTARPSYPRSQRHVGLADYLALRSQLHRLAPRLGLYDIRAGMLTARCANAPPTQNWSSGARPISARTIPITVDGSKAYTLLLNQSMVLDRELIGNVCLENEKDSMHMVGK